jgi:hypothetical protein
MLFMGIETCSHARRFSGSYNPSVSQKEDQRLEFLKE